MSRARELGALGLRAGNSVNIRSIRAFVEVARQRSVSEAAASLGYSQSAVSKQIAEFERGVGSRVFHRDCAGLPLTACGERLLPLAVQVMALVDALGRGEPASRFSADAIGSSDERAPRTFA